MKKSTKIHILICFSGFFLIGSYAYFKYLSKLKKANKIDLSLPAFKEKKEKSKNILEAYDEELTGKKESLISKTIKKGNSSFAKIFQVKREEVKKVKPEKSDKKTYTKKKKKKPKYKIKSNIQTVPEVEKTYFHSYKNDANTLKDEEGNIEQNQFFKAFIAGKQSVKHGSSLVFKLKEDADFGFKQLKKGTLLFGEAKFAKDRILVKISAAKFKETNIPIKLAVYDSDFLPGIHAPGVSPVVQKGQKKLLKKAGKVGSNKILKEVGSGVADLIQEATKTKSVTLERRIIYVANAKFKEVKQ